MKNAVCNKFIKVVSSNWNIELRHSLDAPKKYAIATFIILMGQNDTDLLRVSKEHTSGANW